MSVVSGDYYEERCRADGRSVVSASIQRNEGATSAARCAERTRRARPHRGSCCSPATTAGGAVCSRSRERGVGFRSLHEALGTTTPGGRRVFHVFAALAEFIRELIVQGTHEGLAEARARGERIGRPPAMNAEQIRHTRALLAQPENTITSIAKLLGVSRPRCTSTCRSCRLLAATPWCRAPSPPCCPLRAGSVSSKVVMRRPAPAAGRRCHR
ncbi:recombinase family protein [Streptomyces sp. TRM75561]|uniref:recombinase family protein n=1 Tax=Streptomyces sp. TRM75561 TaxID=2975269 RepID=UPI002448FEE3|nr:recombinase family protein [Streptomyces sp. TRM75561]MDH3038949.1 recombinase family protein [Streptomyces sp. TRM75561]